MTTTKPKHFATPASFRKWLSTNHSKRQELWVAYWKKHTQKPSITWQQSVDEALCFGWIDGLRKSIDNESYMIRFTPRTARSHWSKVNTKRMQHLVENGLVKPAGFAAFERRSQKNSGQAAYEKEIVVLKQSYQKEIKKNPSAWAFYNTLSPSVTKQYDAWVMSGVKEETRLRRLGILIDTAEKKELIPPLKWTKKGSD